MDGNDRDPKSPMATLNNLFKRGLEVIPKTSQRDLERRRGRGRRERRSRDVGAGVSTLMYAAQQGDVNVVRRIIGVEIPSLFQRDRTGKTALHYSSTSGSRCAAQAADLMVMAAPDLVDGKDEDGFTPLHLAVIAGNMQLVTFLLANGSDANAVDNEQHTVVHWAAVCGETAALRAVLEAGAHVSTPDIHGGYPLHYAAQMCGGDFSRLNDDLIYLNQDRDSNLGLQVLQTLLSHPDIQVSVTDVDKREPLLWAASAGSARAVLALVRAGANVEAADKDGLTALHCAASRGHTDCLDTLLTLCGASVDIIDSNGCTALHYAVTLGHADASALLLAHSADPNRQDRKGRSPAHCGCAKGQLETVKSPGANLWLRNARGDFPLHDAAASGRRELVKWLLEMRPSQVNARNNDGRCPLHMAALNDNSDMCKILLDAGAQVNPVLRTSKNIFMTPLDCALQKGYRSTAKYLQLHGGVPAIRLSDPSNPQINSALNFQIRDDVTFYGNSSSESEKESAGVSKSKKKVSRKKTCLKQEKKKVSISGSEKESDGIKLSNQKSIDNSAVKSEDRKKTPSRVDYSNEIIINGKTQVNVTQSSEIILDKESVQTQTSAKLNEKERRPRSAKYGRLRDKSVQSSLNKETMISISSQASVSKNDHSTNTSNEIKDQVNEENIESKLDISDKEQQFLNDRKLQTKENLQDQSSIMSYTSEDAEEPKREILVEASVHHLPKSVTVTEKVNDIVKREVDVNKVKQGKPSEQKKEEILIAKVGEVMELEDTKNDALGKNEIIAEARTVLEEKLKSGTTELKDEAKVSEIRNNKKEFEPKKIQSTIIENLDEMDKQEINKNSENVQKETKLPLFVHETKVPTQIKDNSFCRINDEPPVIETFIEREKDTHEKKITEKIIEKYDQNHKTNLEKDKQIKISENVSNKITCQEKKDDKFSMDTDKDTNYIKEQHQIITKDLSDLSSSDEQEFNETIHKSFRVLNDKDEIKLTDHRRKENGHQKYLAADEIRSKSLENKIKDKSKCSKIPTPLFKTTISKSDRQLNESYKETNLDVLIPSLPNISDETNLKEPLRCDYNMSAPLLTSIQSDKEKDSISDLDEETRNIRKSKKFVKRRSKARDSRSAGSDYESSNLIDSGFEPSPRSNKVSKWKNVSERGVNMKSVTQTIQTNIRRYHIERKIFQQLLELKRHQIRAGQHNEAILVKRAIDAYHKSCASTVGIGRYLVQNYTFKSFEKFLYEALRKLQTNGVDYMRGLPETPVNPLLCTKSTNRCMHAAHAYTGVPCAAYLPKMDHHTFPKIGFNNSVECKAGTGGFLPTINPKKAVTLELTHGNEKQVISLPTDKMDQNKRYYVTFTVKGHEGSSDVDSLNNNNVSAHRHSKSD